MLYHARRGANQTLILNILMIVKVRIIRVVGMINNWCIAVVLDL